MSYTNEDFEAIAEYIQSQYADAYDDVLKKIGTRIKEIGKMSASDAHALQQVTAYGADIQDIDEILQKYSQKTAKEMKTVFENIVEDGYDFAKKFYVARGITQVALKDNDRLQSLVSSIWKMTQGTLKNFSSTTTMGVVDKNGIFVPFREQYNRIIDDAVLLVSTGTQDYTKAISNSVKSILPSGVKVKYESGATREAYSAVRMNVLDGCRQIWSDTREECGNQYSADGVEISVHALCAPDHLNIQGKQYTKAEFEKLNNSLDRPIGTMNCRHTTFPIIMGVDVPTYTDDELKQIRELSNKPVSSGNWSGTRYEASQRMRRYEYRIRQEKSKKALSEAMGDDDGKTAANKKIRELNTQYKNFCKDTGLTPRRNRTSMPKV